MFYVKGSEKKIYKNYFLSKEFQRIHAITSLKHSGNKYFHEMWTSGKAIGINVCS